MSGTHLFYNGVLLRDCELVEYDQVIEQDESHTDVMYSRVSITVSSRLVSIVPDTDITPIIPANGLHPSTTWLPTDPGGLPPSGSNLDWTLPDRLKRIMQLLEEPRKDFWLAINSTTFRGRPGLDPEAAPSDDFLQQDPYRIVLAATGLSNQDVTDAQESLGAIDNAGLDYIKAFYAGKETKIERRKVIDCNNGPKPSPVKVAGFEGARVARLMFTIEICRPYTQAFDSSSSLPPVRDAARCKGIISHRWSIRESIDDEWKTSIAIEGSLRVSDRRYRPDAMRTMTTQYMIPWAKLESREFFQSKDGLSLSYRYNMKEAGVAPPPLTVKWEGNYRESVANGARTVSTVDCRLIGSVTPPGNMTIREYKLYMFEVLMKLLRSRVNLDGIPANAVAGQFPKTQILRDFTIFESMNKPEIGVSAVIDSAGEKMSDGLYLRLSSLLGTTANLNPAPYDPMWWPIPPAYTWDVAEMSTGEKLSLGSAFDQYFQTPVSEWHGKPRGLAVNYYQQGSRESDAVTDTVYMTGLPTPRIEATATTTGTLSNNLFYWSDTQYSGNSYIQFESENSQTRDEGVMVLPLSKPRPVYSSSSSLGRAGDTVSIIPIHAGVQYRTFKSVATRTGTLPMVPVPKITINLENAVETLVKSEYHLENPKPSSDGKTLNFTIQCRFVYALSQPSSYARLPTDQRLMDGITSDLIAIGSFTDGNRVV
jgi:hypothetical protein